MIKILQVLKVILIRPISCIYLIKILTWHVKISLVHTSKALKEKVELWLNSTEFLSICDI